MMPAPVPYLHITTRVEGQDALLVLDGELDYETTSSLEAAAQDVLSSHPDLRSLHVDCAKLGFCDTMGLAGLLGLRRAADGRGAQLGLDNRTRTLDRLLQITGLLSYLGGESNSDASADRTDSLTG